MAYRTLEINDMHASNLKNVRHLSTMDVYAVVSIEGHPQTKRTTPVDKNGGTNPTWNFPMTFNVDVHAAQKSRLSLLFQLKCQRKVRDDKDIGEVRVPVEELLDTSSDGNTPVRNLCRAITTPSGIEQGELNFSYKFYDANNRPANCPPAETGMPPGYTNPQPAPARRGLVSGILEATGIKAVASDVYTSVSEATSRMFDD